MNADLAAGFGMTDHLHLNGGRPQIQYTDEASLRDGLARLAYLAGWDVETEHHVVGWGRPDLYLRDPSGFEVAVEIKLDLTRAASIRKAFQQADVYAKALGPGVEVILTAPVVDRALAERYDVAFTDVWFLDIDTFWAWMHGATRGMSERHLVALDRHREITRQLALSTAVLSRCSDYHASPLKPRVESPPIEYPVDATAPWSPKGQVP